MEKENQNMSEKEILVKLTGNDNLNVDELSYESLYQLLWINYFGKSYVMPSKESGSEHLFLFTMMNKFFRKGAIQDV